MTGAQEEAVRVLLAVLERENAMLRAQDYRALERSTTEKRAALEALERRSGPATEPDAAAEADRRRTLAATLWAAVDENRRLLRQGMEVQHRIMRIIAGAARRGASTGGYGAGGTPRKATTTAAVALVARA